MSHEYRLDVLRQKFSDLSQEVAELKNIRKIAFIAAPPMPQAGAPPMDPAMMQGAPPMDPATGMPIAPTAPPSGPPPVDPALIDQIVGLLEEIGQKVQEQGAAMAEINANITGELQDLGDQVAVMEKRLADGEAAAQQTVVGKGVW